MVICFFVWGLTLHMDVYGDLFLRVGPYNAHGCVL